VDPVRLAVIGMGGMGRAHVRNIQGSSCATLVGFADVDVEGAKAFAAEIAEQDGVEIPVFADHEALISAGLAEAVLIASPHPAHTDAAVAAFQAGLHVLCEKPVAERVSSVDRVNAAAAEAGTVYSVMFQHRLNPDKRRLRRAIQEGVLGRVTRMHFVATGSYRGQSYYDSGAWRGTWAGEGGGVLMNQAPHDLDQVYWQMGPATRVFARCRTTDVHSIEVEDDAEALIDFASGAVGFFAAATCERPGVGRIEIYGDRGMLALADGELTLRQTNCSIRDFNQGDGDRPEELEVADPVVLEPDTPEVGGHLGMAENFFRAIRTGEPLISPGPEAIHSLELANAMVLSSELGRPVDLPIDRAAYDDLADRKIAEYSARQ